MLKKIAIISTLAVSTFILAPQADAQASCRSNWMNLTSAFKTFSPVIAKGVCKLTNKDDRDAANKCLADFDKAVDELDKVVKLYNADAGGGKVGPRGLGTDAWYTGKLTAERTFIGEQILSDSYTVEFKGDGGRNQNRYSMEVCFVDPATGNQVIEPVSRTFTTNTGSFKKTFQGVYGARPMVYLKNSKVATTKAHRYKLYTQQGGEPSVIKSARALLAKLVPGKLPVAPKF